MEETQLVHVTARNEHVLVKSHCDSSSVKVLQDLDMLDVSVELWIQESVVQWFRDSDEGASPS